MVEMLAIEIGELVASSESLMTNPVPNTWCSKSRPPDLMQVGQVVPEWSATIDGFNVKYQQVPLNHMDMCKFASREEIGYRRTVFLINNILRRKFHGKSGSRAPAPAQEQVNRLLAAPEARSEQSGRQYDTEIEEA